MSKSQNKVRPSRDRIVIKHKDAGEAVVLRTSFEKVWKARGWSETSKDPQTVADTVTTVAAKPSKES